MILFKKAVRSIWRNKKAYLACVVLMAIGIGFYIGFNMLHVNLTGATRMYYEEQRFAQVFAKVQAMPSSEVETIRSVPGVAVVDAGITADARVESLDTAKLVTLRLHSVDVAAGQGLNAYLLEQGSHPGAGQIVLGDSFAAAHGLQVGDILELVVMGRKTMAEISGIARSPEYVYAIPDGNQLFPDNETFGFAYMGAGELGTLTGKTGTVTNLALLLEDGVTYDDVKTALEDALAPYGMTALYPRKDQVSEAMLRQEIDQMGSMASSIPAIFILMAVIILYIMLKRVIEQERSQIGTLKAFGFSNGEIVRHYMAYGGITGLMGGVVGVAMSLLLTWGLTEIYLEYFNLPDFTATISPVYIGIGFVISIGSGIAGAYMGTRSVLRLTPSEAMRPAAPPMVKHDFVGRFRPFRLVLTSYGFMSVRNIARNKFRSAFVVCGIAFSFSILAFMGSYNDMFDAMLFQQFTHVQLYDMKVTLEQPQPYTPSVEAAYALQTVEHVEGLLEIPVEIRREHVKESVVLTAMQSDARLYQIYDNVTGQVLEPPAGGVIISGTLADKLGAKRGDTLTVRTMYTGDDDIALPVLGVVNENLGMTAYTDLDSLCRLLEVPRTVSSVVLTSGDTAYVRDQIIDAGNVAAVSDKEETLIMYTELLDSYVIMMYMMQLAGVGIAFAIITNTSAISLSERSREYATMRVLGMHPREIGQVVSFEYWTLLLVGILPGIPLTRLIKMALAGMIDNDLFTMPLDTSTGAYLSAVVGCGIAVAVSNWSAVRKISGFDMVDVLKERE